MHQQGGVAAVVEESCWVPPSAIRRSGGCNPSTPKLALDGEDRRAGGRDAAAAVILVE